ncbi:hypothetical protein OESDEN_01476 [Oesophagostomum dentatum]|uniref:Reverse transcriptase domain-containing protein n=1 Tax=Oesophagostomum dentatum TaxID=61180 RepID=A0A0B1TMQ3_OESDE|nr:hypothetical protein OESDEN_01476 [Oesophagostomum dentatum]
MESKEVNAAYRGKPTNCHRRPAKVSISDGMRGSDSCVHHSAVKNAHPRLIVELRNMGPENRDGSPATLPLSTAAVRSARTEIVNGLRSLFAGVFSPGLGCCTKTKAEVYLKPGARPIYKQKRPVPSASQEAVNSSIDRLVSENVLEPVDHSSKAAPIVVVKKANGTFRLYLILSQGLMMLIFHQHPSRRGLYRYNRLTFRIQSAPGIFQQIMGAVINGSDGVAAYLDDIIVIGRTMDEHRRSLEAFL